jgi:hypothetical protein
MSQNVERLFDFQYTAHEEAKMASLPCAVLSGRFKRIQVKTACLVRHFILSLLDGDGHVTLWMNTSRGIFRPIGSLFD